MQAATYNYIACQLNVQSPTMKQDQETQHISDTVSKVMSALAQRLHMQGAGTG